MPHDEILDRLTSLMRDILDDDALALESGSSANIRLMLGVEEEYGFRFELDEYSEFRNVGDLVSGIRRRIGQPGR
jgi:acyl carrier protein